MKISIILPVWARPQRTRRAIQCVLDQTFQDWELLVIGDACPQVEGVINSIQPPDPRIIFYNMPTHEGSFGAQCRTYALSILKGEYFCFLDNDDIIKPEHLQTRVTSIDGTPYDIVYHNAILRTNRENNTIRHGKFAYGHIGHSELVIRSSWKDAAPMGAHYGHDWSYIEGLAAAGAKHSHYNSATYIVCHTPDGGTRDTID